MYIVSTCLIALGHQGMSPLVLTVPNTPHPTLPIPTTPIPPNPSTFTSPQLPTQANTLDHVLAQQVLPTMSRHSHTEGQEAHLLG